MHKTLASVYAYESELEEWRRKRQLQPEDREPERRVPARSWPLLAVVAVILAAAVLLIWRSVSRPAALPFQERDWVLIARFENRSAEAIFDGTVEHALERELTNSRFINVVPRERIGDALRLMKKPPETVVDRAIGRQVCLRDGGIAALIAGRIEKLDQTYILNASLIDPATGVTVGSFSEEAAGQGEVVDAIQRLSDAVRRHLGEDRASLGQGPLLAKVATHSLRALQLYTHADAWIGHHQNDQAVPLLREALVEDEAFASAHLLLAHALENLGRSDEAVPHFRRALALSAGTPEAERLFIIASYHNRFTKDMLRGVETLEALVRLHPDHYWAVSSLAVALPAIGRGEQALPHIVQRAELRPKNFDHQMRASHALLVAGRQGESEAYMHRARALLPVVRDEPHSSWRTAWLRLYPLHASWLRGDLEKALRDATTLANEIEDAPREDRNALYWETGSLYLTLGRLADARRMFQRMTGPPDYLALIALALGDDATARRLVEFEPPSHRASIIMSRTGLFDAAEKAVEHPESARRAVAPFLPGLWETLARGELALARGRAAEAISLLESAVPRLRAWPTPFLFLGAEALSHAYEQEGDTATSIAVLEDAARHGRESVFWGPAPFFWMRNELRRAALYRRTGREADAQRVEQELSPFLRLADAGFRNEIVERPFPRQPTSTLQQRKPARPRFVVGAFVCGGGIGGHAGSHECVAGAFVDHGLERLPGGAHQLFGSRKRGVDARIVTTVEAIHRHVDIGDAGRIARSGSVEGIGSSEIAALVCEEPGSRSSPAEASDVKRAVGRGEFLHVVRDGVKIGHDLRRRELADRFARRIERRTLHAGKEVGCHGDEAVFREAVRNGALPVGEPAIFVDDDHRRREG